MPIVGLGIVKINGIFRLDVVGARWSARRNVTQEVTGGGVQKAIGAVLPNGSFEEVINKSGMYGWAALNDFSIQLYDYETQKMLLMQAEHCDWANIDGSLDMAGPRTHRNISWLGTVIPVV